VTKRDSIPPISGQLIWIFAFGLLALYVAASMGIGALSADVNTPDGVRRLPNTYASVDHPFHVARAETLWRELASGQLLRWVGQHQGGYPVEFYPLGEAWLEVIVRGLSLGSLTAQGAHSIAVIAIFLLPGVAYAALATIDGVSPATAFLALALHISLPGGWYDGGYTELVQWGLVTNVAGAVASLLMFPALIRYLSSEKSWAAAIASALSAIAVYSNPRSLVGLAALGAGAWLAAVWETDRRNVVAVSRRLLNVVLVAALLSAPELLALLRFGELYEFVRYSGYSTLSEYVSTSVGALGVAIFVLGVAGVGFAYFARSRLAMRSTAAALVLYILLTIALAFVPTVENLASQLEPTRLMPLQRLLTIYLAASVVTTALSWLVARPMPRQVWPAPVLSCALAIGVLAYQTNPALDPAPDPASPDIPSGSLYPVAMSARAEQADLEAAITAADRAAAPGTALLVLGSALSWHQQLWAPLWTERPLFYDNWLWYWHTLHAGTPGYLPVAGHHYPDPEQTLERGYLARHGIGAVVVTGAAQRPASRSPNLQLVRQGVYDTYQVTAPVTTITFGDRNAESLVAANEQLAAQSTDPGSPIVARVNWHPRWVGSVGDRPIPLVRRNDGYIEATPGFQATHVELQYVVQPLDWFARGLAVIGTVLLIWLAIGRIHLQGRRRWYPRVATDSVRDSDGAGASAMRFDLTASDVMAPPGGG
jgi:hypothetical protein